MWLRKRFVVTVRELTVSSPIAEETRGVYAGGVSGALPPGVTPGPWIHPDYQADQRLQETTSGDAAMVYLQELMDADPAYRWQPTNRYHLRGAQMPTTPYLWQVVLSIDNKPATDETAARAVLVANGLDGERIELEPEEPEYGIWLVGLPFLPLPTDEGRSITASEASVVMANGEFQMEIPLP